MQNTCYSQIKYKIIIEQENKTIIAYKGFNKDLKCRGFQYEVGNSYSLPEGETVNVCSKGFHACESPLEVLDYYFLDDDANISRFCEVEQSGELSKEENSTKVASSKIKIKAEIKFADLIKLGVEWLKEKTSPEKVDVKSESFLNDRDDGSAQIGSSGDYAQIGSSGDYAKIGSSGDSAKIGSSGDSAKIGSSGDYAKIDSTGENSVIMCAGHNSIAKAKKGSWITLAEWYRDEESRRWKPKCVKTEYVDGEKIKEDIWYKLVDGEFTEV